MIEQKRPLNILALEPYYDGSHKAFLDEWIKRRVHHWTLMTHPGYTWKWRMHHVPTTFGRAHPRLNRSCRHINGKLRPPPWTRLGSV